MKTLVRLLIAAVLLAGLPANGRAQARTRPDLLRISLEDLLNIEITSASKKEQRAEDVPAAVYVITQEDIRRSGLTSLPELFRLAPGIQVARVNSNKWAVSARGFNDLFSNKLLVLIDGRSIYNGAFSGTFWDGEDLILQDIDRIEIIRGPGGTVWGANAVNGVINIVTKSAEETKGASVAVSAGTFERHQASVRYGGSLGGFSYRLYSQRSEHGDGQREAGGFAGDRWHSLTSGIRVDWSRGGDAIMAQGNFTIGENRPHWRALDAAAPTAAPSSDGVSDVHTGVLLGRWTHTLSDGSLFQVQGFKTSRYRSESTLWDTEDIHDVDLQYQTTLGARHGLVFGGGYRNDDFFARPTFTLDIAPDEHHVFNAFMQDEVAVGRHVKVTVGSKIERDSVAGWGVFPSGRILWNVTPTSQRLWAAVSRARRTPSSAERSIRIYFAAIPGDHGMPIVFGLIGNPEFRTELLTEVEGGYRLQLGSKAAFDVAVFRGSYDDLPTFEPIGPTFQMTPAPAHLFVATKFGNLLRAITTGVEVSARWTPVDWWQLDGSYSGFRLTPRLDPASQDPTAAGFDGNTPQHQWQLHSSLWFNPNVQFDTSLYHMGRLRQLGASAYTRADARVEVKLTDRLSAIAAGQNLLDPSHAEYPAQNLPLVTSAVPRSGSVSLSWKF